MKKVIKKIFEENNLESIKSIEKIEIGFTNKVYSINDKFILKVCEDEDNEKNFEKEVFFYELFKNKLPVPEVIIFDNSKKIHNKLFIIYPKIKGDTLYSQWHLMNNDERRDMIKQICDILKTINKTSLNEFVEKFSVEENIIWREKIIGKIYSHLEIVKKKRIISENFIEKISEFVDENSHVLDEQVLTLVYWDIHFDNVLVENKKVVGILDFERTDLASVDFVLDLVRRMRDYPKKYMSEEFEKFAKREDYENLLIWFKEFYPELFEFTELGKRLDLYSIEHDVQDLIWWSDEIELQKQIAKIVGYKM